jgi:hypothetical protein
MGDLRPNNGGGPPEDGGGSARRDDTHRKEVPDLPAEWGHIVIPDDPSELASEATAIRRELRREFWRGRLATLFGLVPRRRESASLGIPIVIMAVAVITTLLSLFVVTWDHRRSATAPVGPDGAVQAGSVPLASVTLADAAGTRVELRNILPAVILLVDDCDCSALITAVAAQAPQPVTVIPVATQAPCAVGTAPNVRCLADPNGAITGRFPAAVAASTAPVEPTTPPPGASAGATPTATAVPPPPTARAIMVDADGKSSDPVVFDSAGDLAEALARLAAGG